MDISDAVVFDDLVSLLRMGFVDRVRDFITKRNPSTPQWREQLADSAIIQSPISNLGVPDIAKKGCDRGHAAAVSLSVFSYLVLSRRFVPRVSDVVVSDLEYLPGYYPGVIKRIDAFYTGVAVNKSIDIDAGFVVFTPKDKEYGHFLLETLPKLLLARLLIDVGLQYSVVVPRHPPAWVSEFLEILFVKSEKIEVDEDTDEATLKSAIMLPLLGSPSGFHPIFSLLIDHYLGKDKLPSSEDKNQKLFISRNTFRIERKHDFRVLENEAELLELAVNAGFMIVEPQMVTVSRQVSLFRGATHVVGEASSAMHNCLFGRSTKVLSFNWINHIQTHIAKARSQSIDFILPADGIPRTWETIGEAEPKFSIESSGFKSWLSCF